MDMENNKITQGPIFPTLMRFYFPIVLGTFFQMLYSTADAVIVGQFVGKEALGAVGGATGNLLQLCIGFFAALGAGAAVVVSQQFGARNRDGIFRTVHTAIALAIAAGLALTVIGIAASSWMITATGLTGTLHTYCVRYMRIYFTGTVASLIYNLGTGILRAVGDSKRPLYYLIASSIINILLDLLFVGLLGMGVDGAALATVVSQIISAGMILHALIRTTDSYRLIPSKIRFYPGCLYPICRIGLPAGVQSAMYAVSNVLIQTFINAYSTNTIAAFSAFTRIDALFWMALGAMGTAICTFIGQNYGANRMDRVHRSVWIGTGFGCVLSLVVALMMYNFGSTVLQVFTRDPEVLEIGDRIVRFLSPYYFAFIGVEILSSALRGMGDTAIPTVITICGVCVLRIFWLMLSGRLWQGNFLMMLTCYPITWFATSALFVVYYIYFLRKNKLN